MDDVEQTIYTPHEWTTADSINGLGESLDPESFERERRSQQAGRKWVLFATALLVASVIIVTTVVVIKHNVGSELITAKEDPCNINCPIFCCGPILEAVQRARIFNDSKTFVDLAMRVDPAEIEEAFSTLADPTDPVSLTRFVETYFYPDPDDVLTPITPDEFTPNPQFLENIQDLDLRKFGKEVHSIWAHLTRKVSPDVYENPSRYSLIPSKSDVVIVPGGRFRETYYWDTYWIVRGLLVSEMPQTAKSIVENFFGLIDEFGFVPNGYRRYYLNRSQPPLLTHMVYEIYNSQQDREFLEEAVPYLDTEYNYWMTTHHAVEVIDQDGEKHMLNRYYVDATTPRPESWFEDFELAQANPDLDPAELHSDLGAGAESGWDYSSRWFADGVNMKTIQTRKIIPVELNAYLCTVEKLLMEFHTELGETEQAEKYAQALRSRYDAMHSVLYDPQLKQWQDYNFVDRSSRPSKDGVLSNFAPLWFTAYDKTRVDADEVIKSLQDSGLIWDGGLPVTGSQTGQQWDFPNVWSPIQHIIMEGLDETNTEIGQNLARELAQKWVSSNYIGFLKDGVMHEKYDARFPGTYGGGGEYEPQDGFGWTNGVVLSLLQKYGETLTAPDVNIK